MKPIVSCVLVRGNVPYSPLYVHRLRSMAARHIAGDFDFLCLTDQPEAFDNLNILTHRIPTPLPSVFGWWSKLYLFSPEVQQLQMKRRCLYLDLDVIVMRSLMPIIDSTDKFLLAPDDAPNFLGKGKRVTVKRYNSSVMAWNGGEQNDLFTEFRFAVTHRLWGDQDWIGERRTDATVMPKAWFPRLSQCGNERPNEAVVLLCKKPKPHLAVSVYPWVREAWV